MKLIKDFLPINFQRGRKGPFPVDCIVIHVTEGNAQSVRAWFHNPAAEVSSHYLNQKDGTVIQFVGEDDTAWANGRVDHPTSQLVLDRPKANPNWWTISIENEGNGHEELTDPQRASLYELIRDIQSRHSRITTDRTHIIGHHEIYSLKTCPGAISVDRIVRDLGGESPLKRRVLKRGMSGADVAKLQRQLGMAVGNGLGTYGPLTEAAVRSFQRRNRLTVDGVAGPVTLRALEEGL
jgi:N-acetylmuramoyl-L-alanine amidase